MPPFPSSTEAHPAAFYFGNPCITELFLHSCSAYHDLAAGIGSGICDRFLAEGHTVYALDLDAVALEACVAVSLAGENRDKGRFAAPIHIHALVTTLCCRREIAPTNPCITNIQMCLHPFDFQRHHGGSVARGSGKLHTVQGDVADKDAVNAAVELIARRCGCR